MQQPDVKITINAKHGGGYAQIMGETQRCVYSKKILNPYIKRMQNFMVELKDAQKVSKIE